MAVAGWTGLVPTRRASRTYLNLYFSLERTEDLELLTWLYALPVSRPRAAITHFLRAGLATFLRENCTPLRRAAVRDFVAPRARGPARRPASERPRPYGPLSASRAHRSIHPTPGERSGARDVHA